MKNRNLDHSDNWATPKELVEKLGVEHALICVNEILPIAKNYMGFGDIFSKKELFKHYWEDVYQNIIQLKK